jgi:hypothetical protein
MVYFENALCWFFFHHNLKMHGLSCKKEEIHYLYFSPNVIEVVKSRSVRWMEHEAHMGETAYSVW